ATPRTVAAVLLVEHLAVTLIAAAAGLAIGWGLAPLLTSPGAGLLGAAGAPAVTASTMAIVLGVALAVAILATFIPALQAARTSPPNQRITQVMLVITAMLIVLAAINTILITWATVLDARHASALARALGATPQQVSAALSAAQFLSVLPGSLLGVPLGMGLL